MKIVLAICGSISAYKSYELLRSYIKEDIEVKVVLTKGALNFVNADVFKYLGASAVYLHHDDFSTQHEAHILHIDLVKWMDKLVIAPASANTIAKITAGVSDDLLTSVILANESKEIHVFPAMNTHMLNNSITKENLTKLTKRSFFIHPTSTGELACKDIGAGKLLDVCTIKDLSIYSNTITKKEVVTINTGATVAPLDTVRYLTNPASGKTGIELAKVFLLNGYSVNLICGYGMKAKTLSLNLIKSLNIYHEDTTELMLKRCLDLFPKSNVYISSAAICDIKFNQTFEKLKKSEFKNSMEFTKDTDILKEVTKFKNKQIVVGFAAETNLDLPKLIQKLESKNMDYLVANSVSSGINTKKIGFGEDANNYLIISKDGSSTEFNLTKKELAQEILKRV